MHGWMDVMGGILRARGLGSQGPFLLGTNKTYVGP